MAIILLFVAAIVFLLSVYTFYFAWFKKMRYLVIGSALTSALSFVAILFLFSALAPGGIPVF